jgi:hypothetical protein
MRSGARSFTTPPPNQTPSSHVATNPRLNFDHALKKPACVDVFEIPACHVAVDDVRNFGADETVAEAERVALNVHEEEMAKVRLEIKGIEVGARIHT